jgi:hypothetical protein
MGDPDLSPHDPRGLIVFPADRGHADQPPRREWWLVPAAIVLAAAMIAIAFAVR